MAALIIDRSYVRIIQGAYTVCSQHSVHARVMPSIPMIQNLFLFLWTLWSSYILHKQNMNKLITRYIYFLTKFSLRESFSHRIYWNLAENYQNVQIFCKSTQIARTILKEAYSAKICTSHKFGVFSAYVILMR